MKGKAIAVVGDGLVACCAYVHRRVIKAAVNHEEMPKAPKWHVWVKKEDRRD